MIEGINSRQDLERLFQQSMKDYKLCRKVSYQFYCKDPEVWDQLYKQILVSKEVDRLRELYNPQLVQHLDHLVYLLDLRQQKPEQKKGNVIVCNQGDVLYLSCQSDVKILQGFKPGIIDQVDDLLQGTQFHQSLMKKLYEKYIGKIGEKYPTDFVQLSKLANQERQMLDNLYFWVKFEPNPHLVKIFTDK